MGSRSTDIRAELGGHQGRPLHPGDTLGNAAADGSPMLQHAVHDPLRTAATVSGEGRNWNLRVLMGPGDPTTGEMPSKELRALTEAPFKVLPRSDRMAVCLEGANPLRGGEQMSEACASGTIQLPPDGNPLILLAEHQTTGGYKVPGVVIQADLWQVGQMKPGDTISFKETSPTEATAALSRLHAQSRQTKHIGVEFKPREISGAFNTKWIDLNADCGEGCHDHGRRLSTTPA